MYFTISAENIEEATKILSGISLNKMDVYDFAVFCNIVGKRGFFDNLYTEFKTAVDNGYAGRIFDFIKESINYIVKGLNLIKILLLEVSDEVKRRFKSLEYHGEKNLNLLKNELARLEVMQELQPPEAKQSLTTKQKMILADQTGVLTALYRHTHKNTTETARILSQLTGINTEAIRTSIRPILSLYKDDTDRNSPYFCNKNIDKVGDFLNV